MACCGSRRAQLRVGPDPYTGFEAAGSGSGPIQHTVVNKAVICFEYVGTTSLTVTGRATGLRYRFSRRGARMAVSAGTGPSWLPYRA
jgi:hypothetical protein